MSSVKITTLQKKFAFVWRQVSMDTFVNTLLLAQPNGLVGQLHSNIIIKLLHTYQEVSQNLNIALMKFTLLMTDFNWLQPVVMEYVLPVYLSTATSCLLAKMIICKAFGSIQMTCIVIIIFCPQLKSQFKMDESVIQLVKQWALQNCFKLFG